MSSGLAPRPRPWQVLGSGPAGLLRWEAGPPGLQGGAAADRPAARQHCCEGVKDS